MRCPSGPYFSGFGGASLLWRLQSHEADETREQRALKLVGISFFILAAYVAIDAAKTLVQREPPHASVGGMCLAAVSIVVMPLLARAKRRVAARSTLQLPSGRPFLPRSGFIQILPPGKFGTPPCKSGQLEKDLGSEVSSARQAARLIIFEIMRSFFVGFKCPSRSPSGFAIHCGERTEPSARSSSVLAYYVTLTSMAFDLAIGVVGRCTFSTPSRNSAVTFLLSASSGSVKLRRKLPKDRSVRWNFLF